MSVQTKVIIPILCFKFNLGHVVSLDNLDVVYLGHIDTSHGDIMIGERPSTYEHDDISLPFRFILFSQTCVCLSVWISEKWTFELCILI